MKQLVPEEAERKSDSSSSSQVVNLASNLGSGLPIEERFFGSGDAPKKDTNAKRPGQEIIIKQKKSRKDRAEEEVGDLLAQDGPSADGYARTSAGRVSRAPRRPGDEDEFGMHNGYVGNG